MRPAQAVIDTRSCLDWLQQQGFNRLGIVGTSLGSCYAFLASAHDSRIRVNVFNHCSTYFADPVWEGLSTRHIRDSLEGAINLETLRKLWLCISPPSYWELFSSKKHRSKFIYSRYDTTFPVHLSREVIKGARKKNWDHAVTVLPCGHYTMGEFRSNTSPDMRSARFLSGISRLLVETCDEHNEICTAADFLSAGFVISVVATFGQSPATSATATGPGLQANGGSRTSVTNGPTQIMVAPQLSDPAYQGSVPQGAASPTPIALTLADAVNRGLKANLGLLTSEQSSRQTRAERYRAFAGLLPTVTGQLSMTEQQINLEALGFRPLSLLTSDFRFRKLWVLTPTNPLKQTQPFLCSTTPPSTITGPPKKIESVCSIYQECA